MPNLDEIKRMFSRKVARVMEQIETAQDRDEIKRCVKGNFWRLYEDLTGDVRNTEK